MYSCLFVPDRLTLTQLHFSSQWQWKKSEWKHKVSSKGWPLNLSKSEISMDRQIDGKRLWMPVNRCRCILKWVYDPILFSGRRINRITVSFHFSWIMTISSELQKRLRMLRNVLSKGWARAWYEWYSSRPRCMDYGSSTSIYVHSYKSGREFTPVISLTFHPPLSILLRSILSVFIYASWIIASSSRDLLWIR